MTRPDLDALEKLCDAATPGPYYMNKADSDDLLPARVGSTETNEWFIDVKPHKGDKAYRDGWIEAWVPRQNANATASFIVAARTALPEVIMYARRLEGDVANAESSCETMERMLKGAGIDLNEQNAIEKLVEERDAARAEVARLTKERDDALTCFEVTQNSRNGRVAELAEAKAEIERLKATIVMEREFAANGHATAEAEVARLRECWEDAQRVGSLRLTEIKVAEAAVARLRGLVERACDLAEDHAAMPIDLSTIRKEAAGE